MDNFIIGTIRENIKLLFNNLHVVNDLIPTKLHHLSDLNGVWHVDENGNILPNIADSVSIGSAENPIKSCFIAQNSLHIIKKIDENETVSINFGVSEDNTLQVTQENTASSSSDDGPAVQSTPLTVPSKKQLAFYETENNIIINAIKSVENITTNNTIIINSTNDIIDTRGQAGVYISPLTKYSEANLLSDNTDLQPMYYNPDTKEVFRSDGSGHFTELNITGTIKGPAELIIDPSPVSDNGGTVRIKGNLIVDGTQTIISSNVVEIEDTIISIKGTNQESSGFEIKSEDNNILASFLYDGNNDKWKTNNKDLDIGTGKMTVEDISVSSVGKVLLDGIVEAGEIIDIVIKDILIEQDVSVETGIICITLVDSSTNSGSAGIYLVAKIYSDFFYTVLLEKNTGLSNLNFSSETGILTITGANSGVSYEIKKININKILK